MSSNSAKLRDRFLSVAAPLLMVLVLSACGVNREKTPPAPFGAVPTQLELSIGLREGEWGRYSLAQIALIKNLQESDKYSNRQRDARIAFIKKHIPLGISF